IVAEDLAADLRQSIAITDICDEHGHLNHIAQLAAGLLKRAVEILENLTDLAFEIAGKRLARVIDRRGLASEPYRLASFGNDRRRIAALLRALALDEIPCISWT